jgi:hypothetical protein
MVSIASVPVAEHYGFQVLVGRKDFSLLQTEQTSYGAHPALYKGVPGFFPLINLAGTC